MSTAVTWNNSARSIPDVGELSWQALSGFLVDLGNNAQTTNFQKVGMRVATSTPVTVTAVTDCVVVTDLTVAGAVAVNLPAGVTGQVFTIIDGKGDAGTNNITITPAAGTINGAATYVIDSNRAGVTLAYRGTEWTVIAEFISSSSGDIPRSQIAAGTAGYVLINDGSGNMSEEATLSALRGGLATDASAFSGILHATAGVFSASAIVNADIDAAAAIAFSKLAALTSGNILVGSAGNVATSTAVTGDVTISNTGVTAISPLVIVDGDVNASAAIAATKLADGSVDNTEFQRLGTAGTAGAGNLVTTDGTQTITGKTIDGDDNTVQDLALTSLKTALADANKVIRRDAAGIVVSDNALPNSSTLVTTDASQTLSAKTLTSPVLNTSATGTAILDEDNMASDSATHLATQQSIKAYVDTQVASVTVSGAETSAKSADYTITDIDNIRTVLMTTGGTTRTVTLPTAADNDYRIITVKKVDSGVGLVTIDGEGAETIDGATTKTLTVQQDSITIQCDGTSWHTIDVRIASATQSGAVDPYAGTGVVYAGTYTPTYTVGTNIATLTPTSAFYIRVGSIVQVTAWAIINANNAPIAANFAVSLPITSNLAASSLVGSCVVYEIGGAGPFPAGFIYADSGNDRAQAFFYATSNSDRDICIQFTYQVI